MERNEMIEKGLEAPIAERLGETKEELFSLLEGLKTTCDEFKIDADGTVVFRANIPTKDKLFRPIQIWLQGNPGMYKKEAVFYSHAFKLSVKGYPYGTFEIHCSAEQFRKAAKYLSLVPRISMDVVASYITEKEETNDNS